MLFSPRFLTVLLLLLVTVTAPLAAGDAASPVPGPTKADAVQPLPDAQKLGGNYRNLAFASTDKPIYKPGEAVYSRAVVLQPGSYFPERGSGVAHLTIRGPRGEEIARLGERTTDSVAAFTWRIPEGTPGGRYEASIVVNGGPPAVRPFEIRAYTPPRLKTQIEFLREGYGPGDTVTAVAKIERAEGGIPAGAKVTAVARIDGKEAARVENLAVDGQGNCRATFTLPNIMEKGEGSLAFLIEDGGVMETATKTIPILLQNLDIALYPEGGELVAGLAGRLYVQARRPDGKPADIGGEIIRVDASNKALGGDALVSLKTLHEGRGLTEFTPKKGERYALRLTNPSGISRLFPLPAVRDTGAVLRADKESYAYDEPVTLTVRASKEANAARVTLYHREKLLAESELQAGENNVSLKPADEEGVLMATVWNKDGRPLAERLVFRRPQFALRIGLTVESVTPDGKATGDFFAPGATARVTVETKDESGKAVEAVVGLAVTDDSVLEMVEKRDQAPSLPVMVYLENEVKDLADATVYLDAGNPNAARDVDLLLGTQGWRRFVLARLDEAVKTDPDGVRRALAMRIPPPPVPVAARPGRVFERMDMMEDAVKMKAAPPPAPVGIRPAERQAEPPRQRALNQDLRVAKDEEPRAMNKRFAASEVYIPIREYAHKVRQGRKPNDRVDFTETLYWNAALRTNPRDGKAIVSFGLSDSVTTFRVRADGFGNNGALGAQTAALRSTEPFYVEAKLPPVLVAGDKPEVPVALINASGKALDAVSLLVEGKGLSVSASKAPATLAPGARARLVAALSAETAGAYSLILKGTAGGFADSVTRPLVVLPRGFPVFQTTSGLLGPEKPFAREFAIAADVLPGSMKVSAKIYPTPLAGMEEALNALLRQPYGCFEQSSSTNYPLVMAQQYFTSHTGVAPEKIKRASDLLNQGYKRLTGFESKGKGYEWFGGDPAHEALTAYGVMQFTEMSKLMPVDQDMLKRTREWLLSRRDGEGGFKRNPRALDSFGAAPPAQTNIYILWTLLESGEKVEALKTEIAAAKKLAAESKDPYLLALGANVLYLAKDLDAAKTAASALAKAQDTSGALPGAVASITRSGGESLLIETTSLGVLAWLRCGDEFAGNVERAMAWLFERCKAGRFGSTQSTILALKAINAYDAARAKPKAPGSAQLVIDGKPFGHAVSFDQKSQGALDLPDFAAALTPGKHRIELRMTGGGDMPFALEIGYNTPQPASSPECPLTLATALSAKETKEGELVDLKVTVAAPKEDVSMPLAIVGLPAGLEPRHERLKEMVAAGQMAAYEIRGSELVLYWRAFKGGSSTELLLPLIARAPGSYTAPASRVYPYYLEEHKNWAPGEAIKITAR